jgi:DNA-directed RNA polymerase beta subunit
MHTLTEKRKFQLLHLLRAIGFETDKQILDVFNLAEEHESYKNRIEKTGWKYTGCKSC